MFHQVAFEVLGLRNVFFHLGRQETHDLSISSTCKVIVINVMFLRGADCGPASETLDSCFGHLRCIS